MLTYSQIKKNVKKSMCNPPKRVNGAPYVPKLYATSGIDISKCIEGGNIKFTTLVGLDSIYMCVCAAVQSRMHFGVMNVIFFNVFNF